MQRTGCFPVSKPHACCKWNTTWAGTGSGDPKTYICLATTGTTSKVYRCIKFWHVNGLLLRVQFGCLLQQILLGAQIGLTHACARSFSSSCKLRLSWLSQNACKDAREQEKRRKLQNMGNSIADNDSPHARKNARTILRKWFHFWVQIWNPVLALVLASVLSIRIVVPKTGPKTASKTGAKTGPKTGPNNKGKAHGSQQSTNTTQNCGESSLQL